MSRGGEMVLLEVSMILDWILEEWNGISEKSGCNEEEACAGEGVGQVE